MVLKGYEESWANSQVVSPKSELTFRKDKVEKNVLCSKTWSVKQLLKSFEISNLTPYPIDRSINQSINQSKKQTKNEKKQNKTNQNEVKTVNKIFQKIKILSRHTWFSLPSSASASTDVQACGDCTDQGK